MSSLTVYLGPEDKGIWLDSPLGTVGDRGTVTIDSETMTVIYGFGTTYLFVERGDGDSSRVGHVIGATVTASISSSGTSILGTGAGGATDANVTFTTPEAGTGPSVNVYGGDGGATGEGGSATLAGGYGRGTSEAASVQAYGGDADGVTAGRLAVYTAGAIGASGQALVSGGDNRAVWGGLTIAAGVPAGAPAGKFPIAFDTTAVTGGAYYWNGSAWVKFANLP